MSANSGLSGDPDVSETNIKTKIWVQALVRQVNGQGAFAVIAHRGDEDAGAVLVKLYQPGVGATVLTQVRTGDGRRAWMRATGPEPVPEPDADRYIERQRDIDMDLWVVEIEDREGRHPLGDPIL